MNLKSPGSFMRHLERAMADANRLYYKGETTGLTDYEFDMLLKCLEFLEQAFPELASPNSPTKTVGH